MGIVPDPAYNNACPVCFDPNKTPDKLLIEFVGIMKGAAWFPPAPPPIGGTFELTHLAGCTWTKAFMPYDIQVSLNQPGTLIFMRAPVAGFLFVFNDVASCIFAGANQITQPPPRPYIGGKCQMTWV